MDSPSSHALSLNYTGKKTRCSKLCLPWQALHSVSFAQALSKLSLPELGVQLEQRKQAPYNKENKTAGLRGDILSVFPPSHSVPQCLTHDEICRALPSID